MRRLNTDDDKKQKVSLLPKTISIGFFGGLIWSTVAAFAGFFHFTTITPKSFILRSWLQNSWSDQWTGELVSILVISLLSIGFACLYYLMLKKFNGILPGIITGIALWFVVFWLMKPLFSNIPAFFELDSDTIVTTMCLFILYSVFIGYSISFAYQQHYGENN
ncbi:YqhR family membrane protein [Gracilibacillus caseinilyticus]|uniref:YqhR family membrane protein n=1 Tax=Gracilibacillus caseinilyticus TaxID=2932256 RepID=A0ABY4EUC8_9BACI|nr:YqhR family membrane protein [Gracilibacillus caseinilyticus]UOQ47472.1 YqhR family membrane protein [Gracilibacillus caseinilyticus]